MRANRNSQSFRGDDMRVDNNNRRADGAKLK